MVAARGAACHHARLGIVRRRLGDRRRQAAQAEGCEDRQGRLRRTAGPVKDRFCERRRLHLERDHLGRARAQCRLDQGRPRGADHLRRDLGVLFAGTRLRQARRRHLLLAEGARRRGRARHDRPLTARGGAAHDLHAALAAAENLPHDQQRQADRGHFRRRNHQHAVDAVRRGLSRYARLGEVGRGAQGVSLRAPTPTPRRSPTGSRVRPGSTFSPRTRRSAPTPRSA